MFCRHCALCKVWMLLWWLFDFITGIQGGEFTFSFAVAVNVAVLCVQCQCALSQLFTLHNLLSVQLFVPILVAKCRLSHVFRRALRSLWVAFSLLECGFLYHKMWQMGWCVVACWLVLCRFLSVRLIFYDCCFSIFSGLMVKLHLTFWYLCPSFVFHDVIYACGMCLWPWPFSLVDVIRWAWRFTGFMSC